MLACLSVIGELIPVENFHPLLRIVFVLAATVIMKALSAHYDFTEGGLSSARGQDAVGRAVQMIPRADRESAATMPPVASALP